MGPTESNDPMGPMDLDNGTPATPGTPATLATHGTSGKRLSSALGDAVADLYDKGSASGRAAAIWGEAVGPVGMRHTRGIYVEESGREGVPPTLHVYLDGSAFVYEYSTNRILYEQRLAYLGFPVEKVVFQLSRSAGRPTVPRPLEAPAALNAGEPKARPLDELRPLDERRERWARSSVAGLPDDLGDAVYRAMTSSMRRNQDDRDRDRDRDRGIDGYRNRIDNRQS